MADTCVITAEQAERAGAIEFLAAQLLQEVDRVINSGQPIDRRMSRDLRFAADMLRAKKPKGLAHWARPPAASVGAP